MPNAEDKVIEFLLSKMKSETDSAKLKDLGLAVLEAEKVKIQRQTETLEELKEAHRAENNSQLVKIEQEKIDIEKEKLTIDKIQLDLKSREIEIQQQMADFNTQDQSMLDKIWAKSCDGAKILIPAGTSIWLAKKTFKFEETGRLTSSIGKGLGKIQWPKWPF